MSRIALGAAALIVATWTASVEAADLYYGSQPQWTVNPPTEYDWARPYLGGNLGYEWGTVSNNPTRPAGIAGGIQGGFNWQTGQFVFGPEADIQLSAANDRFAPWKFSNPWFGTVRGRAGYAFNNILFYGTAGLAFGELRAQTFGWTESQTSVGWTAGVGAEVWLAPKHWSAKLEYLYINLSTSQFAITGVSNGYSASVVRAGVNYHF